MPQHHRELHPLCTLFPRLAGVEFDTLREDIATNGLRHPIVLLDGMILDGGNRYRACVEAGVEPNFTEFAGGNIVSFVLSSNLHRRHLSAGQQAAIVASAQDWAKARSIGGNGSNQHVQRCNVAPLDTVESRAAQAGASIRTQKMADRVAKADPVLAKQVAHGEVSLPKAVAKVQGKSKVEQDVSPGHAKPSGRGARAVVAVFDPQVRIAELEVDLAAARDNAAELAEMLESYDTVSEGEAAIAKELVQLKAQVRTVGAMRDQWMTTCTELRREVKSLQRRLSKFEGAQ